MLARYRSFTLVLSCLAFAGLGAQAASYDIDPVHSKIEFKVKHLGISTVTGRFEKYAGAFQYDPQNTQAWTAETRIEAASINSDVAKRDDDLRSPNFLDAAKYPDISFRSTGVKDVTPDGFKLLGNLTIHGVTKPVELAVETGGTVKDPWGNDRAAFTATTKVDRRDYGLVWNKVLDSGGLLVGNDVRILLEIEGVKKK